MLKSKKLKLVLAVSLASLVVSATAISCGTVSDTKDTDNLTKLETALKGIKNLKFATVTNKTEFETKVPNSTQSDTTTLKNNFLNTLDAASKTAVSGVFNNADYKAAVLTKVSSTQAAGKLTVTLSLKLNDATKDVAITITLAVANTEQKIVDDFAAKLVNVSVSGSDAMLLPSAVTANSITIDKLVGYYSPALTKPADVTGTVTPKTANDTAGTLVVTVKLSKGSINSQPKEITISGYKTTPAAKTDQQLVDDLANKFTAVIVSSADAKVAASDVTTLQIDTLIGYYSPVLVLTDDIKGKVDITAANDETGTLEVTVTLTKNKAVKTADVIISGYTKSTPVVQDTPASSSAELDSELNKFAAKQTITTDKLKFAEIKGFFKNPTKEKILNLFSTKINLIADINIEIRLVKIILKAPRGFVISLVLTKGAFRTKPKLITFLFPQKTEANPSK